MKNIYVYLLSIAILIGSFTPAYAIAEQENNSHDEPVHDAEYEEEYLSESPDDIIHLDEATYGELSPEEEKKMQELIEDFESQIGFSEDGIDISDVDTEFLEEKYGEEAVEMLCDGIDMINEGIEDDIYEVTENGTIFEPEDENMYVQGAYNKTSATTYWWGRLIKLSYDKANKHKRNMAACKKVAEALGAFTTTNGLVPKKYITKYAGRAFVGNAILATGLAHYTSYVCKRITQCNKQDIGIKYKVYWTCNYTMRAQDKSF